jgi:hypothetical protein
MQYFPFIEHVGNNIKINWQLNIPPKLLLLCVTYVHQGMLEKL